MKIEACDYGICPFCRSKNTNEDNPFTDINMKPFCHHSAGRFWIYGEDGNMFPEKCPLKESK